MSIRHSFAAAVVIASAQLTGCFVTTPGPVVAGGGNAIDWSTNLQSFPGGVGTQMAFFCPAGGNPGTVWGTDIYSDDSSICGAAVHAGVIGFGGGAVRLVVQPGQSQYIPSSRNGVTTSAWGQWGRSFSFTY